MGDLSATTEALDQIQVGCWSPIPNCAVSKFAWTDISTLAGHNMTPTISKKELHNMKHTFFLSKKIRSKVMTKKSYTYSSTLQCLLGPPILH